jgi:hypothetical protein
MSAMLDVEYLLLRPPYHGAMVYRYRSGVLRRNMRAALREVAEGENRLVVTGHPANAFHLAGESLLPIFPIYDWAKRGKHAATNLLAAIASGSGERGAPVLHTLTTRPRPPGWGGGTALRAARSAPCVPPLAVEVS